MPDDTKMLLTDYLEGDAPTENIVIVPELDSPLPSVSPEPTEVVVVQTDTNTLLDEKMKDLMGKVKRIGMCAKDLHYRSKGKPFYGLHLLADLVYQVESDTDNIAEIYFMGDRGLEPPRMDEVYRRAINQLVLYPRNDKYFIGGLMDICRVTMHFIEEIKKSGDIKSGVAAVLDKISEHCLLAIGLLDQTLKG